MTYRIIDQLGMTSKQERMIHESLSLVCEIVRPRRTMVATIRETPISHSDYLGLTPYAGNPDFEVYPAAFQDFRGSSVHFMPIKSAYTVLTYVVCHEMGHAQDYRRRLAHAPFRHRRQLSRYAQQDGLEAYAEAFTEWHLSFGLTRVTAVQWYADTYKWGTPWMAW